MSRRYASFATFLLACALLAPSAASACRIPLRPEALRTVEADAVVLVQVTNVVSAEAVDGWTATAAVRGNLVGSYAKREITFTNGTIVTCHQMSKPKLGRYYVLYLKRTDQGFRFRSGYPYWFARASGDARLAALSKLLPLGAARQPTAEEDHLLDLAEPRVSVRAGISDLSDYTRIYSRDSASSVRAMLFRSRSPGRLMVDSNEELPTADSCKCSHVEVIVDLNDLWAAGELPPFNP